MRKAEVTRLTAPTRSRFRTFALAFGALVAAGAVVAADAVVMHGDRVRVFGWTAVRADGGFVARVTPKGPAAATLRNGDRIVALDGERRAERISPQVLRQFVRGPLYSLTVRRAEGEITLPLTIETSRSPEQYRLNLSLLFNGIVWCVVATLIAVFRPDRPIARWAYAAGMAMGLFFLAEAPGSSMAWLPHVQQIAILAIFPIAPLHLAIGYDFYLRFPNGVASGRLWRATRVALYSLCGALALWSLAVIAVFAVGEQQYLNFRAALAPVDRLARYGVQAAQAIAAVAIFAVLARNYRTVEGVDDRRRLRWILWGAVAGLTIFLVLSVLRLVSIFFPGVGPFIASWNAPANIATVAIPLSFAYAIIKHRVFDITFVVRRGLQYLFAKNALRALGLLPAAGLVYGVIAHRDQPIDRLLLTNSVYLYLIVGVVVSLRFRTQVSRWLDRRFFREAYDRERMLLSLIEDVEKLESASSVSKLVSHELESAFHPTCLFVWYREGDRPHLALSYSSGGYIHRVQLGPEAPLVRLAERESGVVTLPLGRPDDLPPGDRDWLDDAGVRLIVPMTGSDRRLLGLLMLGDKKSEEPYSADDIKLLQAIARQIAVARENVRLKERVADDRRIRHDVLAHLETGHVNLLKECPSCGACYDAPAATCASDGAELRLSLPVERTIDGKYRLDRLIGKGGMGAVYEAADLRLARRVAVKIMLGRAFGDRQALRRFEREAQASARLTHPNIVTVFDFGSVGAEGAFIVMELLQGRTLRAELEQHGRLAPALVAARLEPICAAVAAAHQQRIVHRDLKPENVLVTTSAAGVDVVKVLDFGLAKMTALDAEDGSEGGGLTRPGIVIGTAGYMAPEQLTAGEIDERSDVFALGVIAAEAVTGRRPFRGRTHSDLLTAIMSEPFTLGGEGAERRRLESVLQRALAGDAAARYPSVAELARNLLPALRALPSSDAASGTDQQTTTFST
jgi:GAF domain-containing protein